MNVQRISELLDYAEQFTKEQFDLFSIVVVNSELERLGYSLFYPMSNESEFDYQNNLLNELDTKYHGIAIMENIETIRNYMKSTLYEWYCTFESYDSKNKITYADKISKVRN